MLTEEEQNGRSGETKNAAFFHPEVDNATEQHDDMLFNKKTLAPIDVQQCQPKPVSAKPHSHSVDAELCQRGIKESFPAELSYISLCVNTSV